MEDKNGIIVTISGIRHYIEGGADGIAKFQKEHPVGSHLYLQLKGGTGAFARSVIALDASMRVVGTVSTNDSYIAREFFIGEKPVKVERATITNHLPKAIQISVRDIGQRERPPYIFENKDDDDNAFPLTEDEERAMRLAAHICFMANETAEGIRTDKADEMLEMLIARVREYIDVCVRSISGESIYERRQVHDALQRLIDAVEKTADKESSMVLSAQLMQLRTLAKRLYEAANDMAKTECQVRALRMTMSDLRRSSESALNDYLKGLRFVEEDLSKERTRLAEELRKSLEGKFAEVADDDARLATLIYYFKYSRRDLFLLLTRIIKLEALRAEPVLKEEVCDEDRIRTAIVKILAMTDKEGTPLMKTQTHWYSIYRVLASHNLAANTLSGFVAYINKLLSGKMRLKLTEADLKKNNSGCFLKPIAQWKETTAPVQGAVFDRFLEIAKAFEGLL